MELTKKEIYERCGKASYRRGEAFVHKDAVHIDEASSSHVKAVVDGEEDFHVEIDDVGTELATSCTCPNLASFSLDCQHVAAVLLKMESMGATDEFLDVFRVAQKPIRTKQENFEKRSPIELGVVWEIFSVQAASLMRVSLFVKGKQIDNLQVFLEDVKATSRNEEGYDPNQLYMEKAEERFLLALAKSVHEDGFVPPDAWQELELLLSRLPDVRVTDSTTLYPFVLKDERAPVTFKLYELSQTHIQIDLSGLEHTRLLYGYRMIYMEETFWLLTETEEELYSRLFQLYERQGRGRISLEGEQVKIFQQTFFKDLQRLGKVELDNGLRESWKQPALKAHLYLDRVHDKLLAGLEFHYGEMHINPFIEKTIPQLIRDEAAEKEILHMLSETPLSRTETAYIIQNEELEYAFLVDDLPRIQKHMHVYTTIAIKNRVVKKGPKPRIRVKHHKDKMNWLSFSFEIKGLAESEIKDVLHAVEESQRYYRLPNGSLYSLQEKEMEEIQKFLLAVPMDEDEWESQFDVPLLKGLELMDKIPDSADGSSDESLEQFFHGLKYPQTDKFPVPQNLKGVLKDYQEDGFRWMSQLRDYGFGGILADDMGLGKTIQSIAYMQGCDAEEPFLVVCPSSVTYNWLEEIQKFAPHFSVQLVQGNREKRSTLLKQKEQADVLVTSYSALKNDIQLYSRMQFHTVIFDEAQVFKNPATQTFRAVRKIPAQHRFALTGTPVENRTEELWAIFHAVFPELLGGLKAFSKLTNKQVRLKTQPFLLRRMKKDVLKKLPAKKETSIYVDLTEEQKTLYAAYLAKLRHKELKHLDKETIRKNKIRILAGMTRLRQICNHPGLFVADYHGASAKLDKLMTVIEDGLRSGKRILVFSQFTKMLDIIARQLQEKGVPYFYLDGSTEAENRLERSHRFNEGERDLFLISLKAGGTGLNLTGADTVILYDQWWNPAVEDQAADRVYRIGQTKDVEVLKLVTKGTIEEKMEVLQQQKKEIVENILQTGKQSLTVDMIKEIFDLPQPDGE